MESTFLDYLTLGNPHITARSKGRGRSKTQRVYGPDKQRAWKDMSYENLQSTFGAILSQPMDTPDVRNADEIPSEKTQIFTEKSVQKIAALWNEPVVQHALDGTYEILRAHPYMRFFEGRVQFTENDGRGNLVDEEGKQQRPDWMVYLTGNQGTVDNLIPGDCKLASKWKSEWLKEHNKTSRKKDAIWVLRQATKYMSLGNKRYSFILSEEELVPMRLSIYIRDKKADGNRTGNHHTNQMTIQTETFDVFDPEEDDDSFEPGSNIPRLSMENDPDGSFADASRDTGYILEWCSIPWFHEGGDKLTMNLAFWWLSVLAIQSPKIKQYGSYTPLSETTRGHSPEFFGPRPQDYFERDRKRGSTRRTKRKIDESEVESSKIPKTHGGSIRGINDTPFNPALASSAGSKFSTLSQWKAQGSSAVRLGSNESSNNGTAPSTGSRLSKGDSPISETDII